MPRPWFGSRSTSSSTISRPRPTSKRCARIPRPTSRDQGRHRSAAPGYQGRHRSAAPGHQGRHRSAAPGYQGRHRGGPSRRRQAAPRNQGYRRNGEDGHHQVGCRTERGGCARRSRRLAHRLLLHRPGVGSNCRRGDRVPAAASPGPGAHMRVCRRHRTAHHQLRRSRRCAMRPSATPYLGAKPRSSRMRAVSTGPASRPRPVNVTGPHSGATSRMISVSSRKVM